MRILIVIVVSYLFVQCSTNSTISIPYPPAPPKDAVESFLPGIVSIPGDSLDFNAAFSPDGQSFYFARSAGRQMWDIYVTSYVNGAWSRAEKASFSSDIYSEADPAFGPDGSIYFISNAPRNNTDTIPDYDIWYVNNIDGKWSAPVNLDAVNTDSTEYYVSFAGDGNLYFASSRAGGYGAEDLYISRKVNGTYTTPVNLGPQVNTPYSDHDPALPVNEKFMIYTTDGELHYSINDNGVWSSRKSLTRLNTSTYEYCNYFSPDHKYFFFSSRYDVRWTPVESLPEELQALIPQ